MLILHEADETDLDIGKHSLHEVHDSIEVGVARGSQNIESRYIFVHKGWYLYVLREWKGALTDIRLVSVHYDIKRKSDEDK